MEKVLACIISYNPELTRLKENIENCCKQVDWTIVIDNGSQNNTEIKKLLNDYLEVSLISLGNNEGIAYALNEGIRFANDNSYDWIFTLDQDSVASNGLINVYKKYTNIKNIGMMTCIIRDRNFGIDSIVPRVGSKYIDIDRCITSGAFLNVKVAKKINGYDDSMFIDYVDFDICKKIIMDGYKIIRVNFEGLLHEVGNGKLYSGTRKEKIIYNHNSVRHYYQARNRIYYLRKYKKHLSLREKKSLYVLHARKVCEIIKYEDNKFPKLKSYFKGLYDGINAPIIWGSYKTHEEKIIET